MYIRQTDLFFKHASRAWGARLMQAYQQSAAPYTDGFGKCDV